jgi:hypothetical protein
MQNILHESESESGRENQNRSLSKLVALKDWLALKNVSRSEPARTQTPHFGLS